MDDNQGVVDDCRRAVAAVGAVVAQVGPADLGRSTPCRDWDVRALVEHLIWMCDVFATGLTGATVPAQPVALADDDPGARYQASSAAALEAWRTTEWADMMLELPFSSLPAGIGVRVFVGDQLIHAWDLATALGQAFEIDEDLAAAQLDMMRQYYDPTNRGPQAAFDLAADVEPGSSPSDQLIALSGRHPGVGLGRSGR